MKEKTKTPAKAEELEQLKATLRKWQEVEDGSVKNCTAIVQKSENPLIRLVMEIIRHDSAVHKRVQQAILDSLEKEAFTLQPEELSDIWEMVEEHDEAEQQAIQMAEKARRVCPLLIQRQLIEYLIEDERKHERLLGHLDSFKRQMYPYG